MGKQFTEVFHIPYYDCDTTGSLKVPTLIKMMIKTSGEQSKELGVHNDFVSSFGLTWVITHHDMTIERLPKADEQITITTEAESYNKYFCYRRFTVRDSEGDTMITMDSTFALMDVEARKMGSVREEIIAPFESEKIKRIKRAEKIPPLAEPIRQKEIGIRYWDIDGNKHVNNAVYLEWMMDGLTFKELIERKPVRMLIKYNKEIRYGQSVIGVTSQSITNDHGTVHHILSNNEICAEGYIEWAEG